MKRKFFLICTIISYLLIHSEISFSVDIAYVHIGNSLPLYIKYALVQARIFNETANIYLVCSQKALDSYSDKSLLDSHKITYVFDHELPMTSLHQDIRRYYKASLNFRDGYWLKTVERFYYLHELMQKYHINDLFHLENDALLYVNLEELLPIFQEHYKGIAGVFDDEQQCFPCFMYFKNVEKFTHYLTFLTEQSKTRQEELSLDMHVPINYLNQFGGDFFGTLPIIPTEYADRYGLKNERGWTAKNPAWYCGNIKLFNSVFDAVALGMYFGGVDHRNREPSRDEGPGYVFPVCMFNPARLTYEWIKDAQNRKVPYMILNDKKYRINNLHIHSKDLHKFISY